MKFFTNILALSFLAIVFALPPKETFHQKLQNNINPNGIEYVNKKFTSCGQAGTRCLKLAPGTRKEDVAYYTVNSTKAKCNGEWNLSNGKKRYSGTCFAKHKVNFLIECRKAKNSKNKSNWLGVYFNENDANFMAFGDAKAKFVQNGQNGPLTDQGSTKDNNPIVEISCPKHD